MKILVMNDLLAGGGVENVMQELVKHLYEKGHEITIATATGTNKEFRKCYPSEIHFFTTDLPYAYPEGRLIARLFYALFSRIKRVYTYYRTQNKFDVVLSMKEGPTMQNAARIAAKKKIVWVHTDYQYMHWTAYCFGTDAAEVACMKAFDHVVCVSQTAAKSVAQTIGDPGNLIVRYNPINYRRIVSLAKQPCGKESPRDKFLFVAVGRIAEEKNYSLLLHVCAQLKKHYDFELWILGDGPQKAEIAKLIDQLHCPFVHLLGNQENPFPLIRQADCFVSASKVESYGLAIQEALVLGVPVVTTECPAVREVFDTRCGILCDNSFDGLYSAMEKVIKAPDVVQEFRENISRYFHTEDLYEKRLADICGLWE